MEFNQTSIGSKTMNKNAKTINTHSETVNTNSASTNQPHMNSATITTGANAGRRRSRRNSMDSMKGKRLNIFSKGLNVEKRHEVTATDTKKDEKSDECVALLKRALETLLFEESVRALFHFE